MYDTGGKMVMHEMVNYCMKCIPILKKVVCSGICVQVVWSGSEKATRKSPIAWRKIYKARKQGGLNIISLKEWNKANLIKLLWNLSGKADSLWIRWIHSYYTKGTNIMSAPVKIMCSLILKAVIWQRNNKGHINWTKLVQIPKCKVMLIYHELMFQEEEVL